MQKPDYKIRLPSADPEIVAREIEDFIADQVRKHNKTGGVIGLSGGVDSTTTAALAKRGFDRAGNMELIGYVLPSSTNSPKDAEDAVKVAERLGIRHEVIDIEVHVAAFAVTNPEAVDRVYDKGNMMSRIRANILHTKAATENKLVLGTGNKDEDYGIGYFTHFGDGAVHNNPLGGLSKRLVRQMASYLGFQDMAERTPTAGLEPGQTDFKDLGYSYGLVEMVIVAKDQGMDIGDIAANTDVIDTAESDFAQYKRQYGKTKHATVDAAIDDILRRHNVAGYKAELISPPIAEVTLEY